MSYFHQKQQTTHPNNEKHRKNARILLYYVPSVSNTKTTTHLTCLIINMLVVSSPRLCKRITHFKMSVTHPDSQHRELRIIFPGSEWKKNKTRVKKQSRVGGGKACPEKIHFHQKDRRPVLDGNRLHFNFRKYPQQNPQKARSHQHVFFLLCVH